MSQPVPFGKYKLFERLAASQIAEIYKGSVTKQDGLEFPVLIKVVPPQVAKDLKILAWFVDEAHVASMLNHPNIIKTYEWGKYQDSLFLAMEYLEGYNLASLMQAEAERGVRFPPTLGLYIISEVAKGLSHAHGLKDSYGNSLGLIHRDVNPSNILISLDGQVKLADFSAARISNKLQQTLSGVFQGKATYQAPEQLRNQKVDGRTDLFSLGVILYELLTGVKLHSNGTEAEINAISKAPSIRPPTQIYADIPVELEQLVSRAMAENPAQRPASADNLHGELIEFLDRWDRKADSNSLAVFIQEVRGEKVPETKDGIGFAFGAATSQWMFRGENLDELVKIIPKEAESKEEKSPSFDELLAELPAFTPGENLQNLKPEAPLLEEQYKPPKRRFSSGETVMAIQEGGLGKSRRIKTLVGAVVVLAVLAVGLVVLFSLFGQESNPQMETPKLENAPEVGFAGPVEIRTTPEGALVFVDGDLFRTEGTPPKLVGLRAGERTVKLLAPGYRSWEGKIQLLPDQPKVIEQKLEERIGNISFSSQPSRVVIFFNGKRVGMTPKTISKISAAKSYKVMLKSSGYAAEQFGIGPTDWPEDESQDLAIEKTLKKIGKKKRR